MTGQQRGSGTLRVWHDQRGFGFIDPADGGRRLFAHVSEFPSGRRPVAGLAVTYLAVRDDRGRLQATRVRYVGRAPAARAGRRQGLGAALAVSAVFLGAVATLWRLDAVPTEVLGAVVLLSAITFTAYGRDKAAAGRGGQRTPESLLHTLDLLGGWPGGLLARQAFRHKTVKQPFRSVFWMTVAANLAGLGAWVVLGVPALG